jgi:hypothetical protein
VGKPSHLKIFWTLITSIKVQRRQFFYQEWPAVDCKSVGFDLHSSNPKLANVAQRHHLDVIRLAFTPERYLKYITGQQSISSCSILSCLSIFFLNHFLAHFNACLFPFRLTLPIRLLIGQTLCRGKKSELTSRSGNGRHKLSSCFLVPVYSSLLFARGG